MPTLANLAGAKLPDHKIDGKDIWPLMSGQAGAKSPHESYCYYWGRELQAIRSGEWKLHFPHVYRSLKGEGGSGGIPSAYIEQRTELALYNLRTDISESTDVLSENPDVVARLQKLAEEARADLGDSRTSTQGTGVRPAGQLNR